MFAVDTVLACSIIAIGGAIVAGQPADNTATTTDDRTTLPVGCAIQLVDNTTTHQVVRELIDIEKVNLIEFHLVFVPPNSTSSEDFSGNPLLDNLTTTYRLDRWARVTSAHGQTLVSLAFNYGIMSMTTLTLGTKTISVKVTDRPGGCLAQLPEQQKIDAVLALLMRDFVDPWRTDATFNIRDRVCHEVISVDSGHAKFEDRCYYKDRTTGDILSTTDIRNFWLTVLYVMLAAVRFVVFFFGPLLFAKSVVSMSPPRIPYVIKPKEPLLKTVYLHRIVGATSVPDTLRPKCRIDLSNAKGFQKLEDSLLSAPVGRVFKASITEYDIDVAYKHLMTENRVPVGLRYNLSRAIFRCKIKDAGPFETCCKVNMLRSCAKDRNVPWLSLWKKIGMILFVVCLPIPYYIRLIIFYRFEHEEIVTRHDAAARLGLKLSFDGNLMHYLTPSHGLFWFIYAIYLCATFVIAFTAHHNDEGRLRRVISGSFNDLRRLPWVSSVLHMVVSNVVWPFQRFGLLGVVVAVGYWLFALPLTLVVAVFYSFPTLYLTVRMVCYSRRAFLARTEQRPPGSGRPYQVDYQVDNSIGMFYFSDMLRRFRNNKEDDAMTVEKKKRNMNDYFDEDALPTEVDGLRRSSSASSGCSEAAATAGNHPNPVSTTVQRVPIRIRQLALQWMAATMCVLMLYSCMIVLSECIGCLVEIIVFTMMGVIVNAGTLLKYVSLVMLVIVYSYDSFNNVQTKYLKLNRALFGELKQRVANFEQVTSQPAELQENCGFKSQELSHQADYETPDDIVNLGRRWHINDLVLFVDNRDQPWIPRRLFEDVCQIQVAGVPGPIYRGLLAGMAQFMRIVVFIFFVFLTVLSFGEVYRVSPTNQMLATLAGGFLPVVLRQFMEPERPDIEIGTVKFRTKLDEVIKNFHQCWPLYDLPFNVVPDVEEQADDGAPSGDQPNGEAVREGLTSKATTDNQTGNPRPGAIATSGSSGEVTDRSQIRSHSEPEVKLRSDANSARESGRDGAKSVYFDAVDNPDVVLGDQTAPSDVDWLIILPSRTDDRLLDELPNTGTNRTSGDCRRVYPGENAGQLKETIV